MHHSCGRAPALPSSATGRPARAPGPDAVLSEHPPLLQEGASLDSPPVIPCLPVSCVLLSTDHHLKWPPCHLHDLSVPGDVMSSVKEGPGCPHALSAEFPPQIPVKAAWKDSPDGCGAGARWGPRGWVPWASPVVRVDRDLPAVARTSRQADQLPSPWDHEGASLSSLLRVLAAQEGLSVPHS